MNNLWGKIPKSWVSLQAIVTGYTFKDYQVASMFMKQTKIEAVETEVIEAVAGDLILASRLSWRLTVDVAWGLVNWKTSSCKKIKYFHLLYGRFFSQFWTK